MSTSRSYVEELMYTINCPSDILWGERNSFLLALMVMSSYAIQADGRIMHSEMEFVRNFISTYFGEEQKEQCNDMLLRIFTESKRYPADVWREKIAHCALQISGLLDEEQRTLLLAFLIRIVRADGVVLQSETDTINQLALWLEVSSSAAADIEDLRKEVTNL